MQLKYCLAGTLLLSSWTGLHASDTKSNKAVSANTNSNQKKIDSSSQREITPPFLNMQDNCHLFLSAEFLYWEVGESDLSYALKAESTSHAPFGTFSMEPKDEKYMSATWEPGFRVGIGFNVPHDSWDIFLNYSRLHANTSSSTSVPPIEGLIPDAPGISVLFDPWHNPAATIITSTAPIFFNQIRAKWSLHYNVLDLTMGRKFWISQWLVLRPYTGLRGAWTDIKFNSRSIQNLGGTFTLNCSKRFKNEFDGVGLLAGFQPSWQLTNSWSIYGDLNAALLWSRFKQIRKETTSVDEEGESTADWGSKIKDDWHGLQAVLGLAIGLGWDKTFHQGRYHLAFNAGWESQIWFDHVSRLQLQGRYFETPQQPFSFYDYQDHTTNLNLSGFVLRGQFNF